MAKNVSATEAVVALCVASAAIWWLTVGSSPTGPIVSSQVESINAKVAADAVQQYGITKRNGSPIDACVQAGAVAAAYLQAQDEGAYTQWKATEARDCKSAGVPR